MKRKRIPIEKRKEIFDVQWDKFISEIDQKPIDRDIILYHLTIAQNLDWEYIRTKYDR